MPIRTCIGCRQRAAATVLLRVVAEPAGADQATSAGDVPLAVRSVQPDPRRRAPGRGAWLHPDLRCLDLAQRRGAFGRALRVGRVDPTPVRAYVEALGTTPST